MKKEILDTLAVIFALIGGIAGGIGFFPQVYDNFKNKRSPNISILLIINTLICCSSWLIYAIIKKDIFLICSNIVSVTFLLIILYQRRIYKNSDIRNIYKK